MSEEKSDEDEDETDEDDEDESNEEDKDEEEDCDRTETYSRFSSIPAHSSAANLSQYFS